MMTKVFFAEHILAYRREMAETVRQVIRENYVAGVKTYIGAEPFLAQADLLPPPEIETIFLDCYEGHPDDQVMMAIADDFGIISVYVAIKDDIGNVIESGGADAFGAGSQCWSYTATVPVPAGTHVIVLAAATDCLGGVGALRASKTVR